jgi:Kef-type K+ transport system membrane component KefB/nucleotide-binding universal stress UspA family protein
MQQPLLNEPVAVFLTIMAVILVTPLLSEWLHLPDIAGLIIGGLLVGPHGLNLLSASRTIELLSTVGLIYLMFSAGLEIDLHQFNRVKNKSLVFGLLTFSIPQISGVFLGRAIGLDWPGAVLLGSVYASHTLVAFPILSRLGILKNEAVSVTIGATVITDVSALLVLAIIAGTEGQQAATISHILILVALMAGYTLLILWGLPRMGKEFFKRFTGRSVEFQFVLVALFVAALLAEQVGMHAIVGAFLAGLAINSTLPARSRVVGQVLFLGESFFIPIFLMYIGLIIDPTVFVVDIKTLYIGLALTAAVYLTKYLAAWTTGRIFGYSRDERLIMWGLSQAQAAATLATILVGVQIGLFPQTVFNGSVLMILFTTITSSILVKRFGERIHAAPTRGEDRPLFNRILVPIANPQTQEHLITLAAILARTAKGTLYPVNVAEEVQGRVQGLENQRKLFEADILNDPETDIQLIRRVDSSPAKGILRAAIEHEITLIVMGWRGKPTFRQSIFGTVLDEVVWDSQAPVLIGRLNTPINAMQRIVLVVPPNSFSNELTDRTLEVVLAIARAVNVPLLVLAAMRHLPILQGKINDLDSQHPYAVQELGENVVQEAVARLQKDDLIVVTAIGSPSRFRSSLGYIPEQLAAAKEGSIVVIHYP